jgi:hypothetical protein
MPERLSHHARIPLRRNLDKIRKNGGSRAIKLTTFNGSAAGHSRNSSLESSPAISWIARLVLAGHTHTILSEVFRKITRIAQPIAT